MAILLVFLLHPSERPVHAAQDILATARAKKAVMLTCRRKRHTHSKTYKQLKILIILICESALMAAHAPAFFATKKLSGANSCIKSGVTCFLFDFAYLSQCLYFRAERCAACGLHVGCMWRCLRKAGSGYASLPFCRAHGRPAAVCSLLAIWQASRWPRARWRTCIPLVMGLSFKNRLGEPPRLRKG